MKFLTWNMSKKWIPFIIILYDCAPQYQLDVVGMVWIIKGRSSCFPKFMPHPQCICPFQNLSNYFKPACIFNASLSTYPTLAWFGNMTGFKILVFTRHLMYQCMHFFFLFFRIFLPWPQWSQVVQSAYDFTTILNRFLLCQLSE